ncbi:hypothetical protein B0H13DRAFT_2340373 [Mycena leptocephala]|nr:hypothetical protein B0H13DRAFT_2340373 [Mycena leptocephala]
MRPRLPFASARMLPSAPAAPRLPDWCLQFLCGLRITAISRPAPVLVDSEHHPPGLPASIPLLQTLNMNILIHIRVRALSWLTFTTVPMSRPWLVPPLLPFAMDVAYCRNRAILVHSLPLFSFYFFHVPSLLFPTLPPSSTLDPLYVLMSSLALPAVRTSPRIKKQDHIVLCHPQHENTTPEAPPDHTPRQTGNLVSLTPSLIHTIHTRQHTNPRPLRTRSMPRTRSYVGSVTSPPAAAAISRTIPPCHSCPFVATPPSHLSPAIDSYRPDAADTPAVALAHPSCRRDHFE